MIDPPFWARLRRTVEEGPMQYNEAPPIHKVQYKSLWSGSHPVGWSNVELGWKPAFPVVKLHTAQISSAEST
jgi:hypothetical protein